MKTIIVSCHTVVSKPVKMEVNGTLILPPLVFPAGTHLINLFGYQFTCTFCKIAPFNIGNIFSVAQKWPSLQKRMSKFTQSFLYRIGSRNKVVTHAAFTRPILLCVLSRENAGWNRTSQSHVPMRIPVRLWFFCSKMQFYYFNLLPRLLQNCI
jgi:hypothetical protein